MKFNFSILGCCLAQILIINTNCVLCVPLSLSGEDSKVLYSVKGLFSLKCFVDEPVAGEIQWFKNGSNVNAIDEKERFVIETTADKKESKLTVNKAQSSDAGEYSCRLNEQKVQYDVITNVAVKLPSNSGVVEGEKLKLHCLSVGTDVTIRWILPDNTTIGDDGQELADNRIKVSDVNGIKRAMLTINEAKRSDAGIYTCEGVSEVSGQLEKSQTTVRVKDKFAALWPFLGICSEVFILCVIILIYEKRRTKHVDLDESDTDVGDQKNENHKDIRQRK